MTTSACPSFEMLSAFVDQELSSADAEAVRTHVTTCDSCREELLDWADAEERLIARDCLDPELLVAYSDGVLSTAEQLPVMTHLATCPRCRSEVGAMGGVTHPAPMPAPMVSPWRERLAAALAAFGRVLVRPGPLLSAVTATALVIIALTQLVPRRELPRLDVTASAPEGAGQTVPLERQRSAGARAFAPLSKDQAREEDALRAGPEPESGPLHQAMPPAAARAPEAPALMKKAVPKAGGAKKEAQPATTSRGKTMANEAKPQGLTDAPAAGAESLGLQQGSAASGPAERRSSALQAEEQSARAKVAGTPGVLEGHNTPRDDSPIVARFGSTELQSRVEERNGWTLVELTERRHVWVRSAELDAMMPPERPPAVMHLMR